VRIERQPRRSSRTICESSYISTVKSTVVGDRTATRANSWGRATAHATRVVSCRSRLYSWLTVDRVYCRFGDLYNLQSCRRIIIFREADAEFVQLNISPITGKVPHERGAKFLHPACSCAIDVGEGAKAHLPRAKATIHLRDSRVPTNRAHPLTKTET
jgi:hypothetical protein